jgi:twinkle protein
VRDRFFLIRADDEAPTIDWILDRARVAAIRHGVRGLVIDPYGEVEHKRDKGMNETEYVADVLAKVKRFARNHDVHVWFVAHPMKPQRTRDGIYPVPSLYDISGSAHWSNKADLGVIIERDYESNAVTVHVKKVRFRVIGKVGSVILRYDRATGIYSESAPQPSRMYPDD